MNAAEDYPRLLWEPVFLPCGDDLFRSLCPVTKHLRLPLCEVHVKTTVKRYLFTKIWREKKFDCLCSKFVPYCGNTPN